MVAEGKTSELTVILEQSPPKASDYKLSDQLSTTRLYEKQLAGIGQPLLCPDLVSEGKQWYRFLYVPTFFPPVFIRIDIEPDGTATLLSYTWKGAGGYEWGSNERKSRKLTLEEENDLFATLADIGFWTLPAEVDNPPNMIMLDGTDWFLEGVKDGRCHVVRRYASPLTSFFARQMLEVVAKIKPYTESER